MAKQQTIQTSKPVVAIDLGSRSVRAMAAEMVDREVIRILGYEESCQFPDYMEKGVVTQSSNAGFMIGNVLQKLANRIGEKELRTAFVCVGGRTMQITPVFSRRDLVRKRDIPQSLLDSMEEECRVKIENSNPGVGVLGLVPSYYKLDDQEQDFAPREDQKASVIETHYVAFVAKSEVTTQLNKSFDQSGRLIEESFVRPEALLSAFAAVDGFDTLQRGCAVLDMGAQTTTLTIYKAGQYLFNKVIPQGSHHITRAIAQQGMSMQMAEKLKCEYGFAGAEQVTRNLRLKVPATDEAGGELVVTSTELSELIGLKLEEILAPLIASLNQYADRIQTLYLTGGGVMLQGLDSYLQKQLQVRVKDGSHADLLTRDSDDMFLSPEYSSLIGTILLGADYRREHKDKTVVRKPNFIDRIKDTTMLIFTENQEF